MISKDLEDEGDVIQDQVCDGPESFLESGKWIKNGGEGFSARELHINFVKPVSGIDFGFSRPAFGTIPDPVKVRHFFGVRFCEIGKIGIDEEFIERDRIDIVAEALEVSSHQLFEDHFRGMNRP
jgi:hypothetical protein